MVHVRFLLSDIAYSSLVLPPGSLPVTYLKRPRMNRATLACAEMKPCRLKLQSLRKLVRRNPWLQCTSRGFPP